ncbi:MAG: hypothetical protein GY951_07475 [Psychromonas sp.]|nr:hypothetical protein [Alteromonadales bacterium]MCP5077881.1 hypothetical protein [Psychromonas sp.]
MKLIVGQNVLVEPAECIDIDFAWRSLISDFSLSINVFTFSKGKVLGATKVDPSQLQLPQAVSQDDSGRHFSVQFSAISEDVERIAFYGLLPNNSKLSLNKMSHFQIRVNHQHGKRIASMEFDCLNENHKAVFFFEFYKHNNQWKLGYKLQPTSTDRTATLQQIGLQVIKHQDKNNIVPPSKNTIKADLPDNSNVDIMAGINLKKGQNLAISEHFEHCSMITCDLNVVPKIEDLEFNVVALKNNNTLHNIKDFLYRENTVLRGGGVQLRDNKVLINLDEIPLDVARVQLLITRRSAIKRINSADFIELDLSSSHTNQKIAKYVSETADKNYNTMVLLDFYRTHNGWSIRAIGQGFSGGLEKIGERYNFAPPRLRNTPSKPLEQEIIPVDNSVFIEKHKKMQHLSYFLMGVAGFLLILTFSKFLFLPLACILGGLGWFLFQRSSKALRLIQDEKFERIVLSMIKVNNYQLTPFEIATNCQINIDKATEILNQLCDKGLGHTAINSEGAIYYDFSGLKNSIR